MVISKFSFATAAALTAVITLSGVRPANALELRVNRDTGELSIRNPLGVAVTALDGYTVTSLTAGSLLPSYKGISGPPAGNPGWEKAPTNSTTGLAEFKPSGSFNVAAPGTTVSLGTGFSKTAVASKGLGVSGEDLAFSYHATGGPVVQGQVEYVGTPFLNNISLTINPSNGQATLKNDTLQSRSIDGYSILSSTGALSGTGWLSLADRPGSFPNWQESPVASTALSETNSVAPMTLAVGQSISLGTIGNFSTTEAQNGVSLKFIFGNETTFRFGTVSFTTGLSGDYNADGRVDGHDFLVWQRGGSPSPVSAGDLATWRSNFGAGASAGATAAVPEPGACALAVLALGAVASQCGGIRLRSRRRQGSPASGKTSYAAKEKTHGGERDMLRIATILAALFVTIWHGPSAQSAVTLSFDPSQPASGPFDQSQLFDDAEIPGGTTPGGGTYNSQAYTDNAGPLGQTFTPPPTKHVYALTGVSVKGVGDTGDVIDSATSTWAIRISQVNGTALTPLRTVTEIPTVQGAIGDEWFTFTFTGTDTVSMAPSTQYAFEIYTTEGWFGVDATQGDEAYLGGTGFNSAGQARSFANNTLGNLENHGYDRTFIASLTAPPGGPGDVNNSGAADINDYIIIRNNMETAVPLFTNGDLTGDSYVDLNDFRQWTLAAPPALVASLNIPEPTAAALGILVALFGAGSLRRRGSGRRLCNLVLGAALLWPLAVCANVEAAVTMTFGTTAPTPGPHDQFNFLDDEMIPGGTTPGGGTYNSQAYSDNAGPPGQTFTTPASASGAQPVFALNSIWLKGANTGGGNSGGGVFSTATWAVRISSVSGETLTPLETVTDIPTVTGALGNEWFKWTFSSDSVATLQPLTTYAFDLYSTNGYLGFDATADDASYPNGTAFNSDGGARTFDGLTLGDLASHGYDRTFLVALSPSAVTIGPGDVDLDGDTDLVDYGFIKNNFFLASGAMRSQGDLTGDGSVDLNDYALWKNNAPPAVLAALGVPEPSSMALAALGLAAVARRLHRRRRAGR